jgi:hypothetical protein
MASVGPSTLRCLAAAVAWASSFDTYATWVNDRKGVDGSFVLVASALAEGVDSSQGPLLGDQPQRDRDTEQR